MAECWICESDYPDMPFVYCDHCYKIYCETYFYEPTVHHCPLNMSCRYCGISDAITDIYLVARNGELEGFCLDCYEKHLNHKE